MTDPKMINPARLDCADLDELGVAKKLCEKIDQVASELTLDLRECFLDYGPCSYITDFVLCGMARQSGKKRLVVQTLVDLGSADSMALLLARNAEHVIKNQENRGNVRKDLYEYCDEHGISFIVEVGTITALDGQAVTYGNSKQYDLSAAPEPI